MKQTERIMVACLFLYEGHEQDSVSNLIAVLEEDLAAGDPTAAVIVKELIDRCVKSPRLPGIFGDIISLMISKRRLDDLYEQMDMRVQQIADVAKLLSSRTDSTLAAKIVLKQLNTVIAKCECRTAA
jgi:septation ring formation regulator EzrA